MTNMNYMEYTALMSAVDKIMEGRTVSICENPSWGAELKTFGVNWSACGTQNIEEAKKFAEKINKACKIAEKLNAMGYLVTDKITEIIERKIERSMQRTHDHIKDLEEEARCDGSF